MQQIVAIQLIPKWSDQYSFDHSEYISIVIMSDMPLFTIIFRSCVVVSSLCLDHNFNVHHGMLLAARRDSVCMS